MNLKEGYWNDKLTYYIQHTLTIILTNYNSMLVLYLLCITTELEYAVFINRKDNC